MSRVLIVDDEAEIVTLLRFILEKEGYSVSEAGNGVAALDVLGIEPANPSAQIPDIIILDIMMPLMDGYALNTRLQADDRTRGIPILILTARGQKMRDIFEIAPNVSAYVQKPFDPKMLRELIAAILAGNGAKKES
ncbi:MAG: response regulator [Elusimicrobiota bacterium]